MFQTIFIVIVFIAAAFYLGRMVYRSFQSKGDCTSGCSKCGAADLKKLNNA